MGKKRTPRNARPRKRRVWGALLAVALAAVALILCNTPSSVEANANSTNTINTAEADQMVIRKGIAAELDPLRNLTAEEAQAFVGELDHDASSQETLSHLSREFGYTIDGIDVKGNNATAFLTIIRLDAAQAVSAASQQLQEGADAQAAAAYYASEDPSSATQLVAHALQIIYRTLDESDALVTREVELTLTKEDNVWFVDSPSVAALVNAFFD